MTYPSWTRRLRGLRPLPCREAMQWAKSYSSAQQAWAECKRGDWMLWLVGMTCGDDRSRFSLVSCECSSLGGGRGPETEAARTARYGRYADVVRRHFPDPPGLADS